MPHLSTVNYRDRDGRRTPGQLVNVSVSLQRTPRLIAWCRLFGHRPVVDGTDPTPMSSSGYRGPGHRWVCCDRCGVRSAPQGSLDPTVYAIGVRYRAPWLITSDQTRETYAGSTVPGPIDAAPTGALGAQLIVGPSGLSGVGWEAKVGNAGSEHTLALTLRLGWLGWLYLHTERHGTWLQRRLNPTGYQSRVTEVTVTARGLRWRLWSKRDDGTRFGLGREPWWRNGAIEPRLLDRVLGPRRRTAVDVPDATVTRIVRMPEADYAVRLKLQRVTSGRLRGRQTTTWDVGWSTINGGIPTQGPDRGRVFGSSVTVSQTAALNGTWPAEAAALIAADMTADRVRYSWQPDDNRRPIVVTLSTAANEKLRSAFANEMLRDAEALRRRLNSDD